MSNARSPETGRMRRIAAGFTVDVSGSHSRTGRAGGGHRRRAAFGRPYEPVQVLDPNDPISIGAMVGPDAFTEVRFLQHYKQNLALRLLPEFAVEFKARFGRDSGGLLRTYRAEDAELLVVAMGSVNGTIKDVIDEMRADGIRIGLVTLVSFRPF